MSILCNSNAIDNGGVPISNSLRFQSASSQYLARTPASAGNTTVWTWSAWVKRGNFSGAQQYLFEAYSNGANSSSINFQSTDALQVSNYVGSVIKTQKITTQVFRDPSAWYHIVVSSNGASALNIYVNGVQVTSFSTNTGPDATGWLFNTANIHLIGRENSSGTPTAYLDGYMTQVTFVDGQALTPSSFGVTDPITGQWEAVKYTGTYGTNGFYLPFVDGTSTATLGVDYSGNNNNWNLINFTRSAGVSDCWMYDVPSNNIGPGLGAFQPASNYCVLNPAIPSTTNLINANLSRNGAVRTNVGTIILTNGKYYFETTIQDSLGNGGVGVKQATALPLEGYDTSKCATYFANGEYKIEGGTQTAGFSTYTNGDVIGIAVDTTQSPAKIWFAKNNTWQGTGNPTTAGYSLTSGLDYYFAILHTSGTSSTSASANFGQRAFAYTPPTGFKALCTANLPQSSIIKGNQYMDATLFTGNGSTQTITNAGAFSPDFVWIKTRGSAQNNSLFDTVRGANQYLWSNLTNAETSSANGLTAFNSNGFSVGSNSDVNQSTISMVAWQWDAGSSTVTNTSGSISSQVRANTTAGVSIVTYTGTGANATVGHGLGVAPKMVIVKNRTVGRAWAIYHANLTSADYTLAFDTSAQASFPTAWNSTAPTSSVFSVGANTRTNESAQSIVAYCFAEIAGFSKFGSYTGNGSADGPFVYTGFRPKYVMWKNASAVADWGILDGARDPYNAETLYLIPDSSAAEAGTGGYLDATANGFKIRSNATGINGSTNTIIYMAFAESPFSISNAR